jgi:hypothetical protein
MRYQVRTAATTKMTAFWVTVPCSLAMQKLTDVSEVLASIIRPTNLRNSGKLLRDYMAQYARRPSSSILIYFLRDFDLTVV